MAGWLIGWTIGGLAALLIILVSIALWHEAHRLPARASLASVPASERPTQRLPRIRLAEITTQWTRVRPIGRARVEYPSTEGQAQRWQ